MRRREFITLLGGAAATWPLRRARSSRNRCGASACSCQSPRPIRKHQSASQRSCKGWQQLGWTDGRNVRIEYRWGEDPERIRKYAAELVALAPDVILAWGASTMAPLQQATRTVPIVFAIIVDPVGAGFVESLARPGGNATGFLSFEYGMGAKWLELLKEIAPRVTRAAVLRDPGNPAAGRTAGRDPGRGAVVRGGGEPDRRARGGRD